MTTIGNENDFKFVLQDFSNIYIGMRMTYKEVAEADDTPQRLKTALYMYVLPEIGEDMRVCDHVLSMTSESRAYMVFCQLKGKLKVMVPVEVTDRKGNTRIEYREQLYAIKDFVDKAELKEKLKPEYIMEYKFSKLHLASLAV
nr:hypothetical protein [Lachnospiraceae bacterium]